MKICDIVKNAVGASIELYGEKVHFNRINALLFEELQEKGLIGKEDDAPSLDSSLKLALEIMTEESKKHFDNDINVMKTCLTMSDVTLICSTITKLINNAASEPEPKNVKSSLRKTST